MFLYKNDYFNFSKSSQLNIFASFFPLIFLLPIELRWLFKQKEIHRYREQTEACPRGRGGGWVEKGKKVKKHKLLFIK